MSARFVMSQQVIFKNGKIAPGALANFYEVGTSTRKATYQDEGLTTPHENPVVADANGYFPAIYLDGAYKYIVTDSGGVVLDSQPEYSGYAGGTDLDALRSQLASTSGAGMVGLPFGTVADAIKYAAPQMFGADPTGVEDSAAAISDAINSAARHIVIDGKFLVSSPITITGISNKTIEIRGEIEFPTELLKLVNCSRVTIKGGKLTKTLLGYNDAPIRMEQCFDCHVEKSEITETTGYFSAFAAVQIYKSSLGCSVEKCVLHETGRGVFIGPAVSPAEDDTGSIPTSGCVVSKNRIYNFRNCGVQARSTNVAYLLSDAYAITCHTIENNRVFGMGNMHPSEAGTGSNVEISAKQAIGIEVWGSGSVIAGNHVTAQADVNYSHIGISVAKGYSVSIDKNKVLGNWNYASIECVTSNGSQITKNTIKGYLATSSPAAMIVDVAVSGDPAADGVVVSGNTWDGVSRALALVGPGRSKSTKVFANKFKNCSLEAITNDGGSCQIFSNDFDTVQFALKYSDGALDMSQWIDFDNNQVINCASAAVIGASDSSPGSGAVASAAVASGAVTSISVSVAGTGYSSSSPPAVAIIGGGGTGATATCSISAGGVASVTVLSGGTGYTSAPTVIFAGRGMPIRIRGNVFHGFGSASAPAAVNPRGIYAEVTGNTFISDGRAVSNLVAIARTQGHGSALPWLVGDNTALNGLALTYSGVTGGYMNYFSPANDAFAYERPGELPAASAAPTAGTWKLSDRQKNSAPTAGGYSGWICVAAGSPGTWKEFGAIAA